MNKDLEKEYKELMSADAPDLWTRIEAGLEPKQLDRKKINRLKNMRVWGTAAAACLCLVLAVPVIFGGRKGFSADSGMSDVNMSPAEDAGIADNGAAKENVVLSGETDNSIFEAANAAEVNDFGFDKLKKDRNYYKKYKIFP